MRNKIEFKNGVFYNDDCLKVMPKLKDDSVNLILCDLPYGMTANKWDSVIPFEKLWSEYKRILAPSGVVVLTSLGDFTIDLINSNRKWFRYRMVWVRNKASGFLQSHKRPMRCFEDICVFCQNKAKYKILRTIVNGKKGAIIRKSGYIGASYQDNINNDYLYDYHDDGSRFSTDVLFCKRYAGFTSFASPFSETHPTEKPINLGRYLVRLYTDENDIVLDNACGSGSFLASASIENRKFIGIEKNPDYINMIKERIEYAEKAKQNPQGILFEPDGWKHGERYMGMINVDVVMARPVKTEKNRVGFTNEKKLLFLQK